MVDGHGTNSSERLSRTYGPPCFFARYGHSVSTPLQRMLMFASPMRSPVVWVIEEKTNASLQLPNAFLSGTVGTILAFSIGLLTNAASAQYNDGRKLWCSLQTAATQLSHSVSLGFHHIDCYTEG
jgi:predicted membrane chloride channel (bestrophin family)